MCLRLNTKIPFRETEAIKAYKVYKLVKTSVDAFGEKTYSISSYYQGTVQDVKLGDVITSNRAAPSNRLTDGEIFSQRVAQGIHCFTSPSAIEHFTKMNKSNTDKFITFIIEVQPDDFVAYGSWEGHEAYTNVVAHRIKFVSVKE